MARRKGVLDKSWQQFSDEKSRKERIYYRKFEDLENNGFAPKQRKEPKRIHQSPRITEISGARETRPREVTSYNRQAHISAMKSNILGPRVPLQSNNTRLENKKNESRIPRPKSARPETRHGRRASAEGESDDGEARTPVPRPKSARPESRFARRIDDTDSVDKLVFDSDYSDLDIHSDNDSDHGSDLDSDLDVDIDLDMNVEGVGTGRPKSRRGHRSFGNSSTISNASSVKSSSSPERKIIIQSRDSNKPARKGILKNVSESPHNATHSADTGSYDAGNDRIEHNIDRINSGLNDIDLDLDPVLFFHHGEEYASSARTNKPVLSQEAISAIGKTKTPLKSKPPIGYQGNNQNRNKLNTENSGRYHRNRSSSLHNALPSGNQTSNIVKTRDRIKSEITTSHERDSFMTYRTGAVDRKQVIPGTNSVRRYGNYGNYNQSDSKASIPVKSNKRLDSLIDGSRSRYRYDENFVDTAEEFGMRKPKKLNPITATITSNH